MARSGSKILVVDDQPGIRRLLVEVLTDEGYEVFTAANGYEGIQMVKDHHPELILMDMKMPGMDGIETLREIKQLELTDKVVMMTAYGELELVNKAQQLGAYSYITKPFDIVNLCNLINDQFNQCKDSCQLRIG